MLSNYARMNLYVISKRSLSTESIQILPLSFHLDQGDGIRCGELPISLTGPSLVKASFYELIRMVV